MPICAVPTSFLKCLGLVLGMSLLALIECWGRQPEKSIPGCIYVNYFINLLPNQYMRPCEYGKFGCEHVRQLYLFMGRRNLKWNLK